MKEVQTYSTAEDRLYTDVRTIIEEARLNAIRSVDFSRVVMYWKTGRRVFEEEQNGADRADYGTCDNISLLTRVYRVNRMLAFSAGT